jgi:hypothetical protein
MNPLRRIQWLKHAPPGVRLAVAVACLSGALTYAYIELAVRGNEGADFNQFRAAATLAGTGRLYDYASIRAAEQPFHKRLIPFGRLPFYAVVFKPIALLPYGWGRVAWWVVNVLAIAGFAWTWPLKPRFFVVALFWSCPIWMLLNYGQDTALFLFLASVGLRLLVLKHDFAAGLVLSLCASKFHLAPAIPLFLAANRRWRALAAGAIGGLVILAVSFLAEGPDWLKHLIQLSRLPEFDPMPWRMPNLAGLVSGLPSALALELALAVAALFAVWRICRRAPLEIGMMAALTGGLAVSHHSQLYDCVLLLPALFSVLALRSPDTLRLWALALLVPVPYLFLLDERLSLAGRLLIVGFMVAWLSTLAVTHGEKIAPSAG